MTKQMPGGRGNSDARLFVSSFEFRHSSLFREFEISFFVIPAQRAPALFPGVNQLTSAQEDAGSLDKRNARWLLASEGGQSGSTRAPRPAQKDSTVRRIRWIKASLLTMIAAAPVVPWLAIATAAWAAADSAVSSQQLVKTINTDPVRREDAAAQLLNRPDAKDQIDLILRSPDNPPAQLAMARALR